MGLIVKLMFALAMLVGSWVIPAKADGVMIGFRGARGAFDAAAFRAHAERRGLRPVILSAEQHEQALRIIRQNPGPYELYGYSKGAVAVGHVMRKVRAQGLPRPKHVITVGALRSVNVDWRPYGVPFRNWFDASGRGNPAPGIHVRGVGHDRIQRYAASH